MVPQHILCDMDGTLIDNERFKCEAWRLAVRDLTGNDLDPACHRQIYISLVGLEKRRIAHSIAEYYGISDKEKLLIEYRNRYKKVLYSNQDELRRLTFQPMIAFTRRLRVGIAVIKKGTISLVSSASKESVDSVLNALEIESLFDYKIIGKVKSLENPECYRAALELLQALPGECLAIEDSVIGYQAARVLGIPCLFMPNDFTRASAIAWWSKSR